MFRTVQNSSVILGEYSQNPETRYAEKVALLSCLTKFSTVPTQRSPSPLLWKIVTSFLSKEDESNYISWLTRQDKQGKINVVNISSLKDQLIELGQDENTISAILQNTIQRIRGLQALYRQDFAIKE